MIEIIKEFFKYILPMIMKALTFLLCWGLCFMIGNIVMKLFGVI